MNIHVVDREQAEELITGAETAHQIEGLISIWEPNPAMERGGYPSKWTANFRGSKHVCAFDDAEFEPSHTGWVTPPSWEDMDALVAFLKEYHEHRDPEKLVVFHCAAGVSRSTAAAIAYLAIATGEDNVSERLIEAIHATYERGWREDPSHGPNRRMVWMIDNILGRGGKLYEDVVSTYYKDSRPYDAAQEVSPRGVAIMTNEKPDWLKILDGEA